MPDDEDQDRYQARVGEVLQVRLPQNASTGYVWSLRSLDDGLELVDDRVEPARSTEADRVAPGAARERVFGLRASRPGVWHVEVRLARQWESTSSQERRLTVTVT